MIKKLLVGLGNPSLRYKNTRHNLGFLFFDYLCKKYKIKLKKDKEIESCWGILDGNIILLKPLTFMNLSGIAVKKAKDKFLIKPQDIIVVHDDIDFDLCDFSLQFGRSSAGHRGVESIIKELNTKEFYRLRFGISRPQKKEDVINFLLSKFTKKELKEIKQSFPKVEEKIMQLLK